MALVLEGPIFIKELYGSAAFIFDGAVLGARAVVLLPGMLVLYDSVPFADLAREC